VDRCPFGSAAIRTITLVQAEIPRLPDQQADDLDLILSSLAGLKEQSTSGLAAWSQPLFDQHLIKQ
jgi:hypothetical protein